MKINLEVYHSCTIKRKKPWPKISWIGRVILLLYLYVFNYFLFIVYDSGHLKLAKRATIHIGQPTYEHCGSEKWQNQTSSRQNKRAYKIANRLQYIRQWAVLGGCFENGRFDHMEQRSGRGIACGRHERVCVQIGLSLSECLHKRRYEKNPTHHE